MNMRFLLLAVLISFSLVTASVANAAEASCACMEEMTAMQMDGGMQDCASHCDQQKAEKGEQKPMKCGGGACQCCAAGSAGVVFFVPAYRGETLSQDVASLPYKILIQQFHDTPYQPPKQV